MREAERGFFWSWVAVTGASWFVLNFFGECVLGLSGLALMAIGQSLLLRHRRVKAAGWWGVATIVGFAVGVALAGITGGWLQDSLDGIVLPNFGIRPPSDPGRSIATAALATAFAGACLGSTMATAQWQILRRDARHEWSWLLANIVSWSAAIGASFFVVGIPAFTHLAGGVIVGIGSGLALVHCLPAERDEEDGHHDLATAA